jgi:hypothetical protein
VKLDYRGSCACSSPRPAQARVTSSPCRRRSWQEAEQTRGTEARNAGTPDDVPRALVEGSAARHAIGRSPCRTSRAPLDHGRAPRSTDHPREGVAHAPQGAHDRIEAAPRRRAPMS